jgi:CRP-like cAMP-binding protein
MFLVLLPVSGFAADAATTTVFALILLVSLFTQTSMLRWPNDRDPEDVERIASSLHELAFFCSLGRTSRHADIGRGDGEVNGSEQGDGRDPLTATPEEPAAGAVPDPAKHDPQDELAPLSQLPLIANRLKYVVLQPGQWACVEGDYPDAFFIVWSGRLSLRMQRGGVTYTQGKVCRGQAFGGEDLLRGPPYASRTVGAVADEVCELLMLDTEDYEKLLSAHVRGLHAEKMEMIQRAGMGLFAVFSEKEQYQLALIARFESFAHGETIEKQGDKPSAVYLLRHGTCFVHMCPDNVADLERRETTLRMTIKETADR